MPPQSVDNENDGKEAISPDHSEVLKRLNDVSTVNYPFPIPKKEKPACPKERLNLTSKENLQPLLRSMFLFTLNTMRPPLFLVSLAIACSCTGSVRAIFAIFASLSLLRTMSDVFFLHWITDGRMGLSFHCVEEGIFCKETPRNVRIRERIRGAASYKPTPYLWSADLLTLVPFLLFKGSKGGRVNYTRRWVRVPSAPAPDGDGGPCKRPTGDDAVDEAVALDIAFPPGGHRADRPAFLVLHGLNGGSTEPYVLDLARRATQMGCTVAVMINRGLMKTPMRGPDSFTGARTSDVGCAVDALLYALGGERRGPVPPQRTHLILVGFSMGGIIAANYTAKSKHESGLTGSLSFSGTLCSEKMLEPTPSASHSLSIWQPALAWGLKSTIVKPNQVKLSQRGIGRSDIERVRTVVDIDTELVCRYHGYPTVQDYYADMSAGGRGDAQGIARLNGAAVPLLMVHAMDDPIAIFEVALAEEVGQTENVMLLATKHGGHIGWPTGWFPSSNRWSFMIDLAMEYSFAVLDE